MSNRRQPQRIPPPIDHGVEAFSGETILQELPGDLSLLLWKTVRTVRLWARLDPSERPKAFTPDALEHRLDLLAAAPVDPQLAEEIRRASTVLGPGEAASAEIAKACQQIAEWAKSQEAFGTALEFMQAAAFAEPTNASLAREVALLARQRGEYARAESWFRQAISTARRTQSHADYVRSYLGLGKVHRIRGNYTTARKMYIRALRAASRRSNRELAGRAYHDLATIAILMERSRDVERYARAALEAYGTGHPWLPILAYDVAAFWMERGYFKEAVRVFQAIPSELGTPGERLLRAAALVRSAAAAEDHLNYVGSWREASRLLGRPGVEAAAATALVNMARGAESAGDLDRAEKAAEKARQMAVARGETENQRAAEGIIESVRHVRRVRTTPREVQKVPPRAVSRLAAGFSDAMASGAGNS
jgi:tetratricopeptide (TPR) repeat protein